MERKKACSQCFLGVKNVWTGSKIGVKTLEIKSAEINAGYKTNGPSPRASTQNAVNKRISDESAPNCHLLICR